MSVCHHRCTGDDIEGRSHVLKVNRMCYINKTVTQHISQTNYGWLVKVFYNNVTRLTLMERADIVLLNTDLYHGFNFYLK